MQKTGRTEEERQQAQSSQEPSVEKRLTEKWRKMSRTDK